MQKVKTAQFLLITILSCYTFLATGQTITIRPNWITINEGALKTPSMNCTNCSYSKDEVHYTYLKKVVEGYCKYTIEREFYTKCSDTESSLIDLWNLDLKTNINSQPAIANGKAYTIFTIIPFRKNNNGEYEKLDSLSLKIQKLNSYQSKKASSTVSSSILSSGEWIKISIAENGIYKVDFSFLQKSGLIT
ncbi:MAG: hypothetical protein ACK44N_10315, partial [Bacteroidota bacterium]